MSSLRHPSSVPGHRSPLGLSRLLVGASALAAGLYTTWVIWTALTLSTTAPFGWRLRLLLQESWSAMLVTFGLALATSRRARLRQTGWVLVGIGILGQALWTWLFLVPHRSAVLPPSGHPVFHACAGAARSSTLLATLMVPVGDGPLDDARRERLVDAAYRQYEAELFRFAIHYGKRLGADTMLAENTVQDTFAALLEGRDDSVWQRDASGFRAYLFTSIKQRLATMLRGEDRRTGHEAAAADDSASRRALAQSPTAYQDGNELAERIRSGLLDCPPRMAEAFHLVHEGGLSLAEAATVMGISPKTVSAMLIQVAKRLLPHVQDFLPDTTAQRNPRRPHARPRGDGEATV